MVSVMRTNIYNVRNNPIMHLRICLYSYKGNSLFASYTFLKFYIIISRHFRNAILFRLKLLLCYFPGHVIKFDILPDNKINKIIISKLLSLPSG